MVFFSLVLVLFIRRYRAQWLPGQEVELEDAIVPFAPSLNDICLNALPAVLTT
jgi:hypothetical protein